MEPEERTGRHENKERRRYVVVVNAEENPRSTNDSNLTEPSVRNQAAGEILIPQASPTSRVAGI